MIGGLKIMMDMAKRFFFLLLIVGSLVYVLTIYRIVPLWVFLTQAACLPLALATVYRWLGIEDLSVQWHVGDSVYVEGEEAACIEHLFEALESNSQEAADTAEIFREIWSGFSPEGRASLLHTLPTEHASKLVCFVLFEDLDISDQIGDPPPSYWPIRANEEAH